MTFQVQSDGRDSCYDSSYMLVIGRLSCNIIIVKTEETAHLHFECRFHKSPIASILHDGKRGEVAQQYCAMNRVNFL